MAIDFAQDLADILAFDDLPEATGTITREGEEITFTDGRIVRDDRSARRGNTDERRRTVLIPATGLSGGEPRAKATVSFTGETLTWALLEAEPLAPGGTVIAWTLDMVRAVDR